MEQITIKKTVGAEAPETDSYLPIRVSRVEYEYENASGKYIKKESKGRSITAYDGKKYNISNVGDKVSVAMTAIKRAQSHRQKITFYGEDGTAIDFDKFGIGVEYKAGYDWVYINYYGKKYYYGKLQEIDITWLKYRINDLSESGTTTGFGERSYKTIVDRDKQCIAIMDRWQFRQNCLNETERDFLALGEKIDTMSCEKVFGVMADYDEFHTSNISVPEYNIWKAIISKEGMFELLVSNNCITVEIDMTPAYMGKKPILFVQTNFNGFLKDSEFEKELDSLNITPDFIKSFAIKAMLDKMDEVLYEQGLIEKEA